MYTEESILKRREMDGDMAKRAKAAVGGPGYLFHAAAMKRDMGRDLQDSGHLFALMVRQMDDVIKNEGLDPDDALDEIQWWVQRAMKLIPPGFPAKGDVDLLSLE